MDKAKQDHHIYAKQMMKKKKEFEPFDPTVVPLDDIEDEKTYFTVSINACLDRHPSPHPTITFMPIQGFVFVPKWIQDMEQDMDGQGYISDVITADAAHCDKGIVLAAHGMHTT